MCALCGDGRAGPEIKPAEPPQSGLGSGTPSFSAKLQDWHSNQPVNGAISIPYGIIFPELFEKKKKEKKKDKFFDTFCIFFLKSCLWLLRFETLTVFAGVTTSLEGLALAPFHVQH